MGRSERTERGPVLLKRVFPLVRPLHAVRRRLIHPVLPPARPISRARATLIGTRLGPTRRRSLPAFARPNDELLTMASERPVKAAKLSDGDAKTAYNIVSLPGDGIGPCFGTASSSDPS